MEAAYVILFIKFYYKNAHVNFVFVLLLSNQIILHKEVAEQNALYWYTPDNDKGIVKLNTYSGQKCDF